MAQEGQRHQVYRRRVPGARREFDRNFDRGRNMEGGRYDVIVLGEIEHGIRAAADRAASALRQEVARKAALARAPEGATHYILHGDFADQFVRVIDSSEGKIRVAFIGGARSGVVMFLPPTQLAKPGERVFDQALNEVLIPGPSRATKSGNPGKRTDRD